MLLINILSLLQCMNNYLVTIQMKRKKMRRKGEIENNCMLYRRSSYCELKWTHGIMHLMLFSRFWFLVTNIYITNHLHKMWYFITHQIWWESRKSEYNGTPHNSTPSLNGWHHPFFWMMSHVSHPIKKWTGIGTWNVALNIILSEHLHLIAQTLVVF